MNYGILVSNELQKRAGRPSWFGAIPGGIGGALAGGTVGAMATGMDINDKSLLSNMGLGALGGAAIGTSQGLIRERGALPMVLQKKDDALKALALTAVGAGIGGIGMGIKGDGVSDVLRGAGWGAASGALLGLAQMYAGGMTDRHYYMLGNKADYGTPYRVKQLFDPSMKRLARRTELDNIGNTDPLLWKQLRYLKNGFK